MSIVNSNLSPEFENKIRVHRDSFPIAKNVIKQLLPESVRIQPGKISNQTQLVIEQYVSFDSRESRYDRGIVKIDFNSELPSIIQVRFYSTESGTSEVRNLDKYKLVAVN